MDAVLPAKAARREVLAVNLGEPWGHDVPNLGDYLA
jgi:hypothetical protein